MDVFVRFLNGVLFLHAKEKTVISRSASKEGLPLSAIADPSAFEVFISLLSFSVVNRFIRRISVRAHGLTATCYMTDLAVQTVVRHSRCLQKQLVLVLWLN